MFLLCLLWISAASEHTLIPFGDNDNYNMSGKLLTDVVNKMMIDENVKPEQINEVVVLIQKLVVQAGKEIDHFDQAVTTAQNAKNAAQAKDDNAATVVQRETNKKKATADALIKAKQALTDATVIRDREKPKLEKQKAILISVLKLLQTIHNGCGGKVTKFDYKGSTCSAHATHYKSQDGCNVKVGVLHWDSWMEKDNKKGYFEVKSPKPVAMVGFSLTVTRGPAFNIIYSDDGKNFKTAASVAKATVNSKITWSCVGKHTYWRYQLAGQWRGGPWYHNLQWQYMG